MNKSTRRRPGLDRWIKDTTTPIFGVSRQRRLAFFNQGCEELTGWEAGQVVGQLCNYASDESSGTPQSLADCLCPPPAVFSGSSLSVPIYVIQQSGQTIAREVRFTPLSDKSGEVQFVIGIMQSITQPRSNTPVSATQRLHAELAALRQAVRHQYQQSSFIGVSGPGRRVFQQITCAQQNLLPVHVQGPSGAGKQFTARLIHYGSERRAGSFVPLDCKRLSPFELRQSLRRAFEPETSQPAAMTPGSLYLKNVAQLPRELQQLLLELMNTHATLRIYSSSEEESLEAACSMGQVLDELLYRLTPLVIELPSLRDRREDVPLLAQHFLERQNRGKEKQIGGFSEDIWDAFSEYNWPGNIRELQQVIDECWDACESEIVERSDLPFRFRTGLDAQSVTVRPDPHAYDLEEALSNFERQRILEALEACRHNKSATAQMLKLTRAKLYRRMDSLGIADDESES